MKSPPCRLLSVSGAVPVFHAMAAPSGRGDRMNRHRKDIRACAIGHHEGKSRGCFATPGEGTALPINSNHP